MKIVFVVCLGCVWYVFVSRTSDTSQFNKRFNHKTIPFLASESLSFSGSFNALITSVAALGTTSIVACLFLTISLTVTFKPLKANVCLAMSSANFLADYSYVNTYIIDTHQHTNITYAIQQCLLPVQADQLLVLKLRRRREYHQHILDKLYSHTRVNH